jgi:hypothetical protein
MNFFLFECILKPLINIRGRSGLNKRKVLKEKKIYKKGLFPPHQQFLIFFNSVMPCTKDDFNQNFFERDLALLIFKDMVPLSFVEAPWRLVMRQKNLLVFYLDEFWSMKSCLGWLKRPKKCTFLHPLSLVILAPRLLIYGYL